MIAWTYEDGMKITTPYSEEEVDELIRPIVRSMIRMVKNNQYLEETIKKLKEEAKLAEIRGFSISEKEHTAINEWIDRHEKIHPSSHGVSGKYSYEFLPTTLGTSGTIRCECGARFEFRNQCRMQENCF